MNEADRDRFWILTRSGCSYSSDAGVGAENSSIATKGTAAVAVIFQHGVQRIQIGALRQGVIRAERPLLRTFRRNSVALGVGRPNVLTLQCGFADVVSTAQQPAIHFDAATYSRRVSSVKFGGVVTHPHFGHAEVVAEASTVRGLLGVSSSRSYALLNFMRYSSEDWAVCISKLPDQYEGSDTEPVVASLPPSLRAL